jgi:hypothetical protein
MANFADLPVEVVRRIASFGTYESTYSLSSVNHHFRRTCLDWTVFRDLLRNSHGEIFEYAASRFSPLNTSHWTKFALAEAKARRADCRVRDFLAWAPQMITLHRESPLQC